MKMKFILVMLAIALISGCASKPTKNVVMDGKNIVITDISASFDSNDYILDKENLSKGFYIQVADNTKVGSKYYQNAVAVVKSRFVNHGVKVVDKMEDTENMVIFALALAISPTSADKAAAYSNLPSAEQVAVNTGAVGAMALTNGPAALLGAGIGLMIPQDNKVFLAGRVLKNPIPYKGLVIDSIQSASKFDKDNTLVIYYKLEKGKEAGDDVVLKMAIDEWLKRYIPFTVKTVNGN